MSVVVVEETHAMLPEFYPDDVIEEADESIPERREEEKTLTKGASNEDNQTRTLDLQDRDAIEDYPKDERMEVSEKEEAESLL